MHLVYLALTFLAMVVLLAFKRPLYQAILGGLLVAAALFRISPMVILERVGGVLTSWESMSVLVSMYLISYLQRMLDARNQMKMAQADLNGIFHNRRINATATPMFIGMLPSAAAMLLCGDIVKDSTDGYLDRKEQAVVTSWFRHIPESVLPTYPGVLLMASLSGIELSRFIPAMIVPVAVLALLGYAPFLRKIPKEPETPVSSDKKRDALNLLKHVWTLVAILILILAAGLSVVPALLIVIVAAAIVYRFMPGDMGRMVISAFEPRLIVNTFLVLVLRELISYTGVLQLLPEALSTLPIPTYLIFAILFFLGGIVSGNTGIIALGTPLAFAAMDAGVELMVLLMCMCHAASQISPVHVCLVVASEYYNISLGELVRKTLPLALAFCILMIGYYNLLLLF
ncbi:MAG: DUF401 family protein [Clostridia bacterium]|nr:DUF401 family protein [Clostridia bacterium]